MDDAWGTSRFGYDPLSRLSRRRTPASDTVYYAYDGLANQAIVQYPRTGEAAYFAFDSASRMSGLVSPVGYSGKFLFDPKYATLSRRSFGNGTAVYYMYDGADRVVSIRHVKSDGSPLVYFEYGRDRAGRIVTIAREIDLAVYYGYDAVNRLTSELWARKSDHGQIYGFWYDYDTAHNRMKMRRGFGAGTEWDSAYFGYAADNSPTKRQTNTPAPTTVNTYFYYDANGALIKQWDQGDADATYFWYGPHKLITALKPPGTLASYFYYDGQLNRYAINNAGTLTYYLWDGLKLLEERKTDGSLVARYTHGYAPSSDIGSISEVQRQTPTGLYYQYPHMDHRGTVYAVSDGAGVVQLTYTQDAFGREVAPVGGANPAVPNDNVYQTNWKTMEFGGTRYMVSTYRINDPATGTFLSRDPSGASNGLNLYLCFNADPVNMVDTEGLDANEVNSIVVEPNGDVFWVVKYDILGGTNAFAIQIGKDIGNNRVALRTDFSATGKVSYVLPLRSYGRGTRKPYQKNSVEEFVRTYLARSTYSILGMEERKGSAITAKYVENRMRGLLQLFAQGVATSYDA